MRVLFLDFDGVLNSTQEVIYHHHLEKRRLWRRARKFFHNLIHRIIGFRFWLLRFGTNHEEFCPIAMSNLQYILEQIPDLNIVVSSTWRIYGGLDYVRRVLKRNGIDPKRVIGITPKDGGHDSVHHLGHGLRGEQIQEWLDTHEHLNVQDFVIIDDDSDMAHLTSRLVKTDSCDGLLWSHVEDILKRFKVEHH